MAKKKLPEKIVAAILEDLTDRRGLGHAWDEIDLATMAEIRRTWAQIVRKELLGVIE